MTDLDKKTALTTFFDNDGTNLVAENSEDAIKEINDKTTNLEEINYVKKVYKEITGTTTGQVADYSPTIIDQTNWANIEDNAQVKAIDGSGDITAGDVQTSSGIKVRAIVASNGTYTLTGTPTASQYVIIWQLRGTLKDVGDANIPSNVCLGTITDSDAIAENMLQQQISIGTTLNYGGVLSVNAGDASKYDMTAAKATFVNNYTDPENPTVIVRYYDAVVGGTVENMGVWPISFINLKSDGTIEQSETVTSFGIEREKCPLGLIVHISGVIIESAGNYNNSSRDIKLDIADTMNALGARFTRNGVYYTANCSNVNINRVGGQIFGLCINYRYCGSNRSVLCLILQECFSIVYGQRRHKLL